MEVGSKVVDKLASKSQFMIVIKTDSEVFVVYYDGGPF